MPRSGDAEEQGTLHDTNQVRIARNPGEEEGTEAGQKAEKGL